MNNLFNLVLDVIYDPNEKIVLETINEDVIKTTSNNSMIYIAIASVVLISVCIFYFVNKNNKSSKYENA